MTFSSSPMRDLNATMLKALMAKGKDRLRLGPPHLHEHRRNTEDDDEAGEESD